MDAVWRAYQAFERNPGEITEDSPLRGGIPKELAAALAEHVEILSVRESGFLPASLARAEALFNSTERESLARFANAAVAPEFGATLLSSAQTLGKVRLVDPLIEDASADADLSLTCGVFNFLRLQASEPCYLVQHNFAGEGLFFPLRRCLLEFGAMIGPQLKLQRLFTEMLTRVDAYAGYFAAPRSWAGVFVGNASPNHFFYFQAAGLFEACARAGSGLPAIWTLPGEWFFDLHKAYAIQAPLEIAASPAALSRKLLARDGFVFSLGLHPQRWFTPFRIAAADAPLLTYAAHKHLAETRALISTHERVIWIGISSHKRAWIGETDAVLAFVQEASAMHASIALLLDGWTSTLHAAADANVVAAEQSTIEDVRARLPGNVQLVDLAGADAQRKMALAGIADFFIASHATASMYPARYAACAGVTHISNAARAAVLRQHVHHASQLVPAELVHDEGTAEKQGAVSYRIDPRAFTKFALEVYRRSAEHGR